MNTQTADQRLLETGLQLPPPPEPKGVYRPVRIVDNLAYVSGHGPVKDDGTLMVGRVGQDVTADAAKAAAQQTALAILSSLKNELGSLDRVQRVVKIFGMVNCTPDFTRHPFVINGCSELFAQIWGNDDGVGARSAVGMGSLPDNIPVEIEAVFQLKPE